MGFEEIAFTEHLDLDPKDEGYGFYDYKAVSKKIEELRVIYAGKLKIKKGLEVTYQKEREEEIKDFVCGKNYDFVIGSVHLVGDFDISQENGTKKYCRKMGRRKAYISYFEVTRNLAASGIFDSLGHLEMIRRYAIKYIDDYSYNEFKEQIDDILKMLVEKGLALEVNTSGIRHMPETTYPREEIIRRFLEVGGKFLTIGSDAHLPEHIGYRIQEEMVLLGSMGVDEITIFNRGKRKFKKVL